MIIGVTYGQNYYIVIPSDISSLNYTNQFDNILATISPKVKTRNSIFIIRADLKEKKKINYNFNKRNKIYKKKIFNKKSSLTVENTKELYDYIDTPEYREFIKIDKFNYQKIHYSTIQYTEHFKTLDNLKRAFETIYLSIMDKKNSVIFFYVEYEDCKRLNRPAIVYPQTKYQAIPYDEHFIDYHIIHFCWENTPNARAYILRIYESDSHGRSGKKIGTDIVLYQKEYINQLRDCSNSQIVDYPYKASKLKNNAFYKIEISSVCGAQESNSSEMTFMYWDCNKKLNWDVRECSYEKPQ